MNVTADQLEINVNLHALQPDFLNSELHYVIAKSENVFRFAAWNEEAGADEKKFYCFLTEKELLIPAGNIVLKQSYALTKEPLYPFAADDTDFITTIESMQKNGVAKCIRRFLSEDIDVIKRHLEEKYGLVEKHVVTSRQGQHLIFVIGDIEVSISAAMVYFRHRTPFSESHYADVKDE